MTTQTQIEEPPSDTELAWIQYLEWFDEYGGEFD